MPKQLISFLLVCAFAWHAMAQEDEAVLDDPETQVEAEDATEEDASGSSEVDDVNDGVLEEAFEDETLDEQTYEEDEDDFIPTEEIPADEPIPFPSNI